MSERFMMGRRPILAIGIVCGLVAAVFQAWTLYLWLGSGFWFWMLLFPISAGTLQVVAGTVALTLYKQYGDPTEELLPGLDEVVATLKKR
ncbi:MAG: hypothetical protein KUG77_10310 [Nannocystaceae bacterium]|nr:hypothetical protein [Nannocystaceae bacterium]